MVAVSLELHDRRLRGKPRAGLAFFFASQAQNYKLGVTSGCKTLASLLCGAAPFDIVKLTLPNQRYEVDITLF